MRENTKKLSEFAYKALKNKVMGMDAGSYISTRQFAEDIGVSYTPVREAFLRLQKEGSLKLVPNVGFFVTSLDINDIIQIFQVRECLEAFVLDKVFDRILPEHIEEMKEIISKQEEAISKNDLLHYQQLDIKFHEILFNLYGNKLLQNFYRDIREQYMICSKQIASFQSHDAVNEHANLFYCLENNNKDGAISCLKNHIHQARERTTEGYISVLNGS